MYMYMQVAISWVLTRRAETVLKCTEYMYLENQILMHDLVHMYMYMYVHVHVFTILHVQHVCANEVHVYIIN